MSVEGVWKAEILGLDGWEPVGTAFVRNDRYLAASADHYSTGSYKVNGESIVLEIRTIQHGKIRALFGKKKQRFDLRIEGTIENADSIVGRAKSSEGETFDYSFRMIRVGELD